MTRAMMKTFVIGAAALLTVLSAGPAQAQDDEGERHRSQRFKFHFDADSLHLDDFAMHFTPPDLSGLDKLKDLHFDFRDPMALWFGDEPYVFLSEHSDLARLEQESRELARRARQAEGAEREELERELRQRLEEIFDAKMELRRERIEELEERLQEEREDLRRRGDARQSMIERRFNRLLGEDDALEW